MKVRKMIYKGKNERIFPNYGLFKPGQEVDYNETLLKTGLFREKKGKEDKKEGDE